MWKPISVLSILSIFIFCIIGSFVSEGGIVKIVFWGVAGLIFGLILYLGKFTPILKEQKITSPGALKTEDPPYSFGRFQLWLWTLVICPIISIYLGNALSKIQDDKIDFKITNTTLILLGISAGSTFVSLGINQEKISKAIEESKQGKAKDEISLKNKQSSKGFLFDLIMDAHGNFSIPRLQNLVFTLIYVLGYIAFFFSGWKLQEFTENTPYILMGISSGLYLGGKGLNK